MLAGVLTYNVDFSDGNLIMTSLLVTVAKLTAKVGKHIIAFLHKDCGNHDNFTTEKKPKSVLGQES